MFKNFITSNKNNKLAVEYKCYLTTVYNYNQMGLTNSNSIYTSRAYHLLPIMQQIKQVNQLNEVDCTFNPNNLFEILMNPYECTLEIQRCESCSYYNTRKKPVTPIPNTSIVTEHNYKNLEEKLNHYFSERHYYCTNCQRVELLCQYILGPYLWLDVEDAYKNLDKSYSSISSNLADLPVHLIIQDQKFILSGAIEYRPGHFVAHCYNAQFKYWQERNDMNDCSIKHKSLPSIRINSILYVKWQCDIQVENTKNPIDLYIH